VIYTCFSIVISIWCNAYGHASYRICGGGDMRGVAFGCDSSFICLDAVLKVLRSLEASVNEVKANQNTMISLELDPWMGIEESQRTKETSQSLREAVFDYYHIQSTFCMVCRQVSHRATVVSAHIWPAHTHGKGLEHVGLRRADVNNARNMLRLCKPIEEAFDRKEVMIVAEGDEFLLVVLNPDLMDKPIEGTDYTFRQCHRYPLQFCSRRYRGQIYPYRRLLAVHAHRAICKAVRHNWPCDYADPMMSRQVVQTALGQSLLDPSARTKVMEYLDSYDRAFV